MRGRWGLHGEGKAEVPLMHCTSVVIADRHPVVLQGLTKLLGAQSGFKVVACCSDAERTPRPSAGSRPS